MIQRDPSDTISQRRDHTRTQPGDGRLPGKERGPRRTQLCRHPNLGLPATRMWENNHPPCGTLLWQLLQTNAPTCSLPRPAVCNQGIPETFHFSHYQALPLLCLPLSLCQNQAMMADSLATASSEYQPLLVLIRVVFIYFHTGRGETHQRVARGHIIPSLILRRIWRWTEN